MPVRYYLKNKHSKKPTLIVGAYSIDAKTFTFSTGIKVKSRHFSEVTRRIKGAEVEREAKNLRLDRLAREVPKLYEELMNQHGYVTNDRFKKGMLVIRGKKKRKAELLPYIEELIEQRKRSGHYARGSLDVYNATFRDLSEFAEVDGEFDFADLSYPWFVRFRDFVYRDSSLSDNTVRKRLETFKMFLNEATKNGVNDDLHYKTVDMRDLKLRKTPSDTIYLTESEVQKLYSCSLEAFPALERVRDAFVAICYIGARHSDWGQVNHTNIKDYEGVKLLTYYAKKTGAFCVVPVLPIVNDILNKYDGQLPVVSNQKTNNFIKRAGEKAGLNDQTAQSKVRRGNTVVEKAEKWKFVTTHTARRTLVTIMKKKGLTYDEISILTGHASGRKMVEQYDKAGKIEKAIKIARQLMQKA